MVNPVRRRRHSTFPSSRRLAVEHLEPRTMLMGASLQLNGQDGYVLVPYDPALSISSSGAMTIEAWVRPAATNEWRQIVNKGSYSLWLAFGQVYFGPGNGEGVTSTTPLPPNVWTHVAVVWAVDSSSESQRFEIYINGDRDFSDVRSGAAIPAANDWSLGLGGYPYPSQMFAGQLAEVRLWNTAREQDDVRRTMHVALEEPLPGLVASWHLSDGYVDCIGSHEGTPVGGAYLSSSVSSPPELAQVPVDVNFNTLPHPLEHAATAYVPGFQPKALLVGGMQGSSLIGEINAVDLATGETTLLGSLPGGTVLSSAAAAYAPETNRVYVFGGHHDWSVTQISDKIYSVDPKTGACQQLSARLPQGVTLAAAAYHAGLKRIYLIGGASSSSVGGRLRTIYAFDPNTETVTTLGLQLPEGRDVMPAVYSQAANSIYVFGGATDSTPDGRKTLQISLDKSGLTGTVTEVAAARLASSTTGIAAVVDPTTHLVYLFGGIDDQGRWLPDVSAFDPLSGQLWKTYIKLKSPADPWSTGVASASVAFDPANRHALVMGGSRGLWQTGDQVWRVPLGSGPAVPLGRWDFPGQVDSEVTSIDGDDRRVVVGTTSNGAYRYDTDGTSYHHEIGEIDPWGGFYPSLINDVDYDAQSDTVSIATDDMGVVLDRAGSVTRILGTTRVISVDNGFYAVDSLVDDDDDGLTYWVPDPNDPGTGTQVRAFSRQHITDLVVRDPQDPGQSWRDIWGIAPYGQTGAKLINALVDLTDGTPAEFEYGLPGNMYFTDSPKTPNGLALGLNGDWWVVSAGGLGPDGTNVGLGGIAHIAAASVPDTDVDLVGSRHDLGELATSVDVDADGRAWVSLDSAPGKGGGLAAYESDGKATDPLRTKERNWLDGPVGSNQFDSIADVWESGVTAVGAADERVWAAKTSGQLVTYAPRWSQLDESNQMADKCILGVWTARGRLFAATSDSLHVLMPDGKTWDNRTGVGVLSVMADRQGRIWVGTDQGPRLYEHDGWDDLSNRTGSRPTGEVYALAEDQAGRIWIGGREGLTLFDQGRFVTTFTADNSSLPDQPVQALLVDRFDRLWVGTPGGLALFDEGGWAVYTTADGLPDNAVYDLAQAGDGAIAVSTADGLSLYDGSQFADVSPGVNLHLTVDKNGHLWGGNLFGSVSRTADGWEPFYWTNSGLRSSQVFDVAADGGGRVWFCHGTAGGLSVRGSYLPPLTDVVHFVDGITPDHGKSGDSITVSGSGFGGNKAEIEVTVGGTPLEIVSVTDTAIVVKVRDDTISGPVSVVRNGRRVTPNVTFRAEPTITSFTPEGGNDGVMVEIRGTNFDTGGKVFLGSSTARDSRWISPTVLEVVIEPSAGSGPVRVQNLSAWSDDTRVFEATSSGTFHRIGLNLQKIVLNQGISSQLLAGEKPTLVQSYLSSSVALRANDRVEIDTVRVTLTAPGGPPETHSLDYRGPVPTTTGAPTTAQLRDIVNSVNVTVWPSLEVFKPTAEEVQVNVEVLRNGRSLATGGDSFLFTMNRPLGVLLVPIMRNNYTLEDLNSLKNHVNNGLADLIHRIWPLGRVAVAWSPRVYTIDQALVGGGHTTVDIGGWTGLHDCGHELEDARDAWNARHTTQMVSAFGVLDTEEESGDGGIKNSSETPGLAFWPEMEWLNKLLIAPANFFCKGLNLISALFGGDDVCNLEFPTYVAWGEGRADFPSALITHEVGHTLGLVKFWANNHDGGNLSHSQYDEGREGCSGVFDEDLTLYAAPNVTEPIVNPITGLQLRRNDALGDNDRGDDRDSMGVYVEGVYLDSPATVAGEVVRRTYRVQVTDGTLTLRLKDLGGDDKYVAIAGLEIVGLGRSGITRRFDFGDWASPLATGFSRVTPNTRYEGARQHGWHATAQVASIDRGSGLTNPQDHGLGTPLTQDFNRVEDATFFVDVPNGVYDVTVTLGDIGRPRAKSVMSYACGQRNDNVFFEPYDIDYVRAESAIMSYLHFTHDLAAPSPAPPALQLPTAQSSALSAYPTESTISAGECVTCGPRLSVSGTINETTGAGQLVQVRPLGENAKLTVSLDTGYWVVQLDGAGRELARTGLFPVSGSDGSPSDVKFFSAKLLKEDGLARLELRKDDQVLDVFAPGTSAPTVSLLSPAGGSYQDGVIPVEWSAHDADGDAVQVTVDYSADGGATWTTVAGGAAVDTAPMYVGLLAGSNDARFRVTATDGFNSASAISPPIQVAAQPPRLYIDHPFDGTSLLESRAVTLSGGADDNQDGPVSGERLRWHSDRDGDLGTGAYLRAYLSPGPHVLTLEAENTKGLTASTQITVTVAGDYDRDGLSDEFEAQAGYNPLDSRDAYSDDDGDGLPLIMELKRGLNPSSADSDGDGRTDDQEIADGTNPSRVDTPLPPDAISVSPAELVFQADLSKDVPYPQQQVIVTSREAADWTLTADADWLAASAAQGTTPQGTVILVDVHELSDGTHTGNLRFTSNDLGNTVVVPVTVTVTNSYAHFDVDGDGQLTDQDKLEIQARVGMDNTHPDFHYRYDVDRDGDIDQDDVGWTENAMAEPSTRINTGLVETRTATDANGEAATPPGSLEWIDEWDSFWVEIWGETPDTADYGISGFSADLVYNTAYFTATSIEYGPAFSGNQSGSIDDAAGRVANIGAATPRADVGDDKQVLLARVRFEPTAGDDGCPHNADGQYITPVADLGLGITDATIHLVDIGSTAPELGNPPDSELWPVMYDIDDDGRIGFGDLAFFATAFQQKAGDPGAPFAWACDFDHSERVDVGDLAFLAENFQRTPGDPIVYPGNFPDDWRTGTQQAAALTAFAPAESFPAADRESLNDSVLEAYGDRVEIDETSGLPFNDLLRYVYCVLDFDSREIRSPRATPQSAELTDLIMRMLSP